MLPAYFAENKYKINATNIRYIYRKNRDGIVAKIDDDMLRHYCNEDVFLMQVYLKGKQKYVFLQVLSFFSLSLYIYIYTFIAIYI